MEKYRLLRSIFSSSILPLTFSKGALLFLSKRLIQERKVVLYNFRSKSRCVFNFTQTRRYYIYQSKADIKNSLESTD
jgi:hypothetical protein